MSHNDSAAWETCFDILALSLPRGYLYSFNTDVSLTWPYLFLPILAGLRCLAYPLNIKVRVTGPLCTVVPAFYMMSIFIFFHYKREFNLAYLFFQLLLVFKIFNVFTSYRAVHVSGHWHCSGVTGHWHYNACHWSLAL